MKKKPDKHPDDNPLSNPRDKLYKTINNERLLRDIKLEDIIFRCGELLLDFDDTCNLCADQIHPEKLKAELNNPLSNYYSSYRQGVSEGKLNLNINLENLIGDPKAKDAYKSLSDERQRQSINKKLKELFLVEGE